MKSAKAVIQLFDEVINTRLIMCKVNKSSRLIALITIKFLVKNHLKTSCQLIWHLRDASRMENIFGIANKVVDSSLKNYSPVFNTFQHPFHTPRSYLAAVGDYLEINV